MKARFENDAEQDQWRPNLPTEVLIQILCRLPIKTLISFKSVCKLWLNLISEDNHFADLHLQTAPIDLILRSSRKLHLGNIQFHNASVSDFKHTLLCNPPNLELLPNPVFANSCNGFLCFSNKNAVFKLMDAVICNPVTGEFITVPAPDSNNIEASSIHAYGLGFSEKENRFKLLRAGVRLGKCFAQICTFEKGSLWRDLGECPFSGMDRCFSPLPFLGGKLHFTYYYMRSDSHIDCFDFDDERFGKVPLPPSWCDYDDSAYCKVIGKIKLIGELRSCLYASHFDVSSCFNVWVMKKYGVADSWTKLFSFNRCVSDHCFPPPGVVVQLGNGEMLLCSGEKRLVLYNPALNDVRSVGWDCTFIEVIPYSPTLILLKDALAGYEACVQNLNSRDDA